MPLTQPNRRRFHIIKQTVKRLLEELPEGAQLVAAAKAREPGEILEAVDAGIKIIGENYIQEAEKAYQVIGNKVKWHFIGHLQKNKVKKAVAIFNMIETVDSFEIAQEIDRKCAQAGKIMPVLIEINSGREAQKSGVFPEKAERLITEMSKLPNIRIEGLMTMGPTVSAEGFSGAEESRPYFRETKILFEKLKRLELPRVEMKYLSMGMSASYQVALEEGANVIRLGEKIFGERPQSS
jgi:PLP dependent protein